MNTKGWIAVFWLRICGFLMIDSISREGFRVPRGQGLGDMAEESRKRKGQRQKKRPCGMDGGGIGLSRIVSEIGQYSDSWLFRLAMYAMLLAMLCYSTCSAISRLERFSFLAV